MAHVNVYTGRANRQRASENHSVFHNGDICTKCSSQVKCKNLIARLIGV